MCRIRWPRARSSTAECRLFTGNQRRIVSADLCKGSSPHEHIATAELAVAGHINPIQVQDTVIDRAFRMKLPPMSPNSGNRLALKQSLQCGFKKVRIENRVAIEKENILRLGARPARVPAHCGRRALCIERNHLRAQSGSNACAAIRGT